MNNKIKDQQVEQIGLICSVLLYAAVYVRKAV